MGFNLAVKAKFAASKSRLSKLDHHLLEASWKAGQNGQEAAWTKVIVEAQLNL